MLHTRLPFGLFALVATLGFMQPPARAQDPNPDPFKNSGYSTEELTSAQTSTIQDAITHIKNTNSYVGDYLQEKINNGQIETAKDFGALGRNGPTQADLEDKGILVDLEGIPTLTELIDVLIHEAGHCQSGIDTTDLEDSDDPNDNIEGVAIHSKSFLDGIDITCQVALTVAVAVGQSGLCGPGTLDTCLMLCSDIEDQYLYVIKALDQALKNARAAGVDENDLWLNEAKKHLDRAEASFRTVRVTCEGCLDLEDPV